ncbi:DUF418 domain-containing protein [Streptomyces jumonjinensis]|uniref:DUF418 domain-containing protein n=1 Tax=Streptomyces jumonjinensis TaxID=1945 RepID=A0A646KFN5_STRJU|nr:DUF418 domain-containing protein [Streptomyces jumonjinensis]MQT00871.1 DUF418 domain-containing protein [Streptomyces jumonjinensis]
MTELSPSPKVVPPGSPARPARLPLLDVLRGVAILGTLMTNVWIFTAPGSEWGVLTGGVPEPSFASFPSAVESSLRLLANGKFLSLLTILFGVGLAIQYGSAARRGAPWPGRYRWRALFLFAEGTVHFILVFAWDVLMGYAVTALFVAWLLARSTVAQNRVMWWAAGLHLALMALLTAALAAEGAQSATPVSREAVDLYARGGYWEQVGFRLDNAAVLRLEPVLSFFLLVFLFLLGVRLFRAGAFGSDATGRRIRARLLGWGLGLGLPLSVVSSLAGPELFLLDRYVGGPLTALGYIGLTGAVTARIRRPGPLLNGLTSVGRTALSGYVLQNMLCVLLAYGVGLGLAHRLDGSWSPWWVIAMWALVCAVLLVGSTLWLRRFETGPLESVQKWALRR